MQASELEIAQLWLHRFREAGHTETGVCPEEPGDVYLASRGNKIGGSGVRGGGSSFRADSTKAGSGSAGVPEQPTVAEISITAPVSSASDVTLDVPSVSSIAMPQPLPLPSPCFTPAPSVSNYEVFSTANLQTICKSRGIDTRLRNRADCIKALGATDQTPAPQLYQDLRDLKPEGAVSEVLNLSPPMKPGQPLHSSRTEAYPVRVQQFEGPPNAQGERTLGERVVWHVPFTPAEIRTILAELPDYRVNPR
ncbi:unnamed protein product [Staurois parvus]|uniref:Uncharacterized protein n=1 Tax=Staurois parvus TaxID=386267 RepID=A0ABN9GD05_9NEOB|nr:unnamed protein product [Staurois parvus]